MVIRAHNRSTAQYTRAGWCLSPVRSGVLCLVLLCGNSVATVAADGISDAIAEAAPQTAPPHAARQHSQHPPVSSLDQRMQLLTKELDLDARQQDSVRTILLLQRAEVIKASGDPSVPAAIRVSALQGISERTAERIRSVLTDAQREKYLKARPHETPVGAPGGDVEKWMTPSQLH